MKNISIEYAHIYTNQKINKEHELSLEILTSLRAELNSDNKSSSLVVMVDDYSFPDPSFNYDDFTEWLATQGHAPDLVLRESQFIPICDEVIRLLPEGFLKEQLIDYIKTKKYPCSLFIAAWYLLRLGYLNHQIFDKRHQAKALINILPQSFRPFEDKALEIIKATQFSEAAEKVEYKFFEGRLVF